MEPTDRYIRPSRPCAEEVMQLSVMDQLMPRRHMSYLLCFRIGSLSDARLSLEHLQHGLAATLTEMPQFAGTLKKKSGAKNELELILNSESGVLFRTSDKSSRISYDNFMKSMYCGPLLTDNELSIPLEHLQTASGCSTRALAIQATVVTGGMLLTASIHHVLADAKASEVFFDSWAKHTARSSHGRAPVPETVPADAVSRWRLSYGPKSVQMDSFPELRTSTNTYSNAKVADRIVASTWKIAPQAMQNLKDEVGLSSDVQISNSDLICALICRHVYKARTKVESSGQNWPDNIILFVTSDMRSRLEPALAKNYLGNASVAIPVAINLNSVVRGATIGELSNTAAQIKTSIDKFDSHALRSRLGFYKDQPYYGSVIPKFDYYPGPNMLITDSSSMSFYSLNWGANLHHMEYFRSIGQTHSVGQCALNPKRRDGSIELQMRHDLQIIESMKSDPEFSNFFTLEGFY